MPDFHSGAGGSARTPWGQGFAWSNPSLRSHVLRKTVKSIDDAGVNRGGAARSPKGEDTALLTPVAAILRSVMRRTWRCEGLRASLALVSGPEQPLNFIVSFTGHG